MREKYIKMAKPSQMFSLITHFIIITINSLNLHGNNLTAQLSNDYLSK
jgi:hypothetical protein